MADTDAPLHLFAIAVTGVLKDGSRAFLVGAELATDKKAAARSALVEIVKYRPQYTGNWQDGPQVTVRQVPETMLDMAMADRARRRDGVNGLAEVEILPEDSANAAALADVPVVAPDSSVD